MARARHALSSALLLLASGSAVLAAATPADAGVIFQSETGASAIHFSFTQAPASSIITAELVDDAVGYTSSAFDSNGGSEALAATAFPGNLVVQGPGLFCTQVFTCPAQPPAYPLLADASYPRQRTSTATANGQAVGSGPLVITPLTASARATAHSNEGHTEAGSASFFAGTPAAVTVDASRSVSTTLMHGRRLVLHVESTVSGIDIGGLVHIDALHAIDDVTLGASARPIDRPRLVVTGVTVAGQQASIDQNGVHVLGHDGPSLTQELGQRGLVVRTVGTHRADGRRGARSDVEGLSIDFGLPVSGLPYIPNPLPPLPPPLDGIPEPGVNANGTYLGHLVLGAAGAAATLGHEPSFSLGGVTPSFPATAPTSSPPASALPGSGQLAPSAAGPPPTTAPPPAGPGVGVLRGLLDAISRHAIDSLYLVLALGTAGLFVGWRVAVALRSASTARIARPASGGQV